MEDTRFAEKMKSLTNCDACGGDCHNASGFCSDCRTPDHDVPNEF